jgi:hypothetical protein
MSRGSSVSVVSHYGLDDLVSISDRSRGSASRPALGPTEPPIQWAAGALFAGVKSGRGVMLTTHPLLVPRLRESRSCTSCHPKSVSMERNGTTLRFFTFMKNL